MRAKHQSFISCLSMFFLLSVALSHCAFADDAKSTFTVTQQIDQLDAQVSQARILLQTGKAPTALSQLRAAATDSWKVLFSVSGKENFLTSTEPIPTTGIISRVARQAADVHYWWGMASAQLNSPDEAITAFARAARLCPAIMIRWIFCRSTFNLRSINPCKMAFHNPPRLMFWRILQPLLSTATGR